MSTLHWFYEAAVERILRKRLQERYDEGFLAGIDTAYETVHLRCPGLSAIAAERAIKDAREDYLEEVASRGAE
jgi:hypothetical protein